MKRFSDILKRAREKYPLLAKRMNEAAALSLWEQAVGSAIAKHARALCVKEGVLWVEVDHPIWQSELHYRKRQIIDLMNQKGGAPITDILLLSPRDRV